MRRQLAVVALTLLAFAPAQARPTAKCNDGTYSYSKTRSGTCSHHGGVAYWINKPAK